MAARRHLPAAVLREGDAGAENAVRLVPAHAVDIKVGHAVIGYRLGKRNARLSLTKDQFQAAERIKAVSRLLAWRAAAGEDPDERALAAALEVLADAARFFPSGRYSLVNVRDHLPVDWRSSACDAQVLHAISTPRPPRDGIMSNREAGRILTVQMVEVLALEEEDGGRIFPLVGIDEPEAERALRRAARDRQMDRELKRRKRAEAKSAESNTAVRFSSTQWGFPDNPDVTFPANAVIAALQGGAVSPSDVAAATGKTVGACKMALRRLTDTGHVLKLARGRYAAVQGRAGRLPPCRPCELDACAEAGRRRRPQRRSRESTRCARAVLGVRVQCRCACSSGEHRARARSARDGLRRWTGCGAGAPGVCGGSRARPRRERHRLEERMGSAHAPPRPAPYGRAG